MKLKSIFTRASVIAMLLIILVTGAVYADEIANNLDGSVDATWETTAIPVGGTASAWFYIHENDTDDDVAGCNVDGSPATVTLSVPAGVVASATQLTFTACEAGQKVEFSSESAGTYEITASSVSGGKDGSEWTRNTARFRLVVDGTPPVITPNITGTAGANGWYTSDVSVIWTISDPETAYTIDDGCVNTTFNTEIDAPGTKISCKATSVGGSSEVFTKYIKIDKTAPSNVKLEPARAPDHDGWYKSSVTFSTTSDLEDGSAPAVCTAVQTFTDDTTGTTVTGSCTNEAGLTANATPITLKLDSTPPTAETQVISGTLGLNNWYTSNVTLNTVGTDISPVTCTDPNPKTVTADIKGKDITGGTCTDIAGNTSDPAETIKINLDKTAPPTAKLEIDSGTLGDNGWYTSNVVLKTTCGKDTISGNEGDLVKNQTINNDTKGTAFTDTCVNKAGLSKTTNTITIKRDTVKPTIEWDSDIDDGEVFLYDDLPDEPGCDASDATSGVASCTVTGYSDEPGFHTMTAKAIDKAGNQRVSRLSYTVEGLTIRGFYSPLVMGPKANSLKNITNIEIRWEVFRGAKEVLSRNILEDLTIARIQCPWNTNKYPYDAKVISYFTINRSNILRDSGTFLYKWRTPVNVGYCYTITARMANDQSISTWVKVRE